MPRTPGRCGRRCACGTSAISASDGRSPWLNSPVDGSRDNNFQGIETLPYPVVLPGPDLRIVMPQSLLEIGADSHRGQRMRIRGDHLEQRAHPPRRPDPAAAREAGESRLQILDDGQRLRQDPALPPGRQQALWIDRQIGWRSMLRQAQVVSDGPVLDTPDSARSAPGTTPTTVEIRAVLSRTSPDQKGRGLMPRPATQTRGIQVRRWPGRLRRGDADRGDQLAHALIGVACLARGDARRGSACV